MQVTTTPAPRSAVVLEVDVPAAELKRAIDLSLRHVAARTRVPGFRPGKAPRSLVERAIGGSERIHDEAKEHLFESTVIDAIRQEDLDPLEIPQPEWLSYAEGEGARYRVTLQVRPDVRLGAYTDYPFGITIEPVTDAKVDEVLEQLRDQHASLVPVEGRPVRNGDYAVIGFEGTRDGVPFEGGTAERFPLVVGAERMIPGFESKLLGMSEGEDRTFEITFPDDYPDESLAGREAQFHVTLGEVREKKLPELDQDFVQTLGDYADVDALRTEIRRRLEINTRDRARHEFADRIIEFAVANATVEIPDLLIDREVEVMHDELKVRLAEQGIDEAEYLRVTEKDSAKLHAEYREPAEHRVKVLLVLSAIADAEGVDVGEDQVEAELTRARVRYAEQPKLLEYFESERGRSYLASTLRRTQVVESLVDRWLAAHPEVGPVPHAEDAEPAPGTGIGREDLGIPVTS